ncbi:MAG: TIGR03960 family B12-binding radical SAM protein [Candidatus Zixiibacteriota bacterium]
MRELLEKKLFPYVLKPGRYTGGEPGQVVRNPVGRLKYLHAYPDKYELGQSHIGLQNIYHIINNDDRFLCERVFAVDRDAEKIMRRENIPLFSLESSRPAAEFDVIGFSLVDESVYTNLLAMLDLAGLPLHREDRNDSHPLIIAGGPAAYNPEPVTDFIDLFFIGDAEEGLPELLGVLKDNTGKTKIEKLEALCRQVESVYVPAFYDDNRKPLTEFAPEKITARVLKMLKPEYYPEQPIVPLIEIIHNHLGVEIMRGCPQSCRFCMAGQVYRPVRLRPQEEILQQAEKQWNHSGYEEVSLMSLSSSDYPGIEDLAGVLARRLEARKVSIALPSLRPGTISPALLDAVKKVRNYGLTIAPEAGTERLRLFIRKNFPDEAIYDTAHLAFQKGWTTIKMYFMVGLPTETDDDLQGIVELCRRIRDIGRNYPGKKTINVSLSPFIPKPFTPFQWDEAIDEREAYRRIAFLKKRLSTNQINVKYENTQLFHLMAIMSRGDRKIGAVIESAYRKGCRFDHWSEEFQYESWLEALQENGIDSIAALKAIPFSEPLPWEHIVKGATPEHLRKEREKTSIQLKDYIPQARPDIGEPAANGSALMAFGRGKKKLAARNNTAPTKNRFRIRWGKTDRYKYMSHLDNLRLIERTIRKARIPVAYSQGFNPSMKLSFGPPLPLGFTSEAEYVDITLEANFMTYMVDQLKAALPEDIIIYDYRAVLLKNTSLTAALNRVVFTIPVNEWTLLADLELNIEKLMQAKTLIYNRTTQKGDKEIDLRPGLYELKIDNDRLVMILGLGDGGYVRPTEIAGFMTDGLKTDPAALTCHRLRMYREEDGHIIDAMDL